MRRAGPWAALLLCAGCRSDPSVPFKQAPGVHGYLLGGPRNSDERIVDDYSVYGIELVVDSPATPGWGYEGSLRIGSGDGDKAVPAGTGTAVVMRETDYWELCLGVRQTFRAEQALQPYFGLGANWIQSNSTHEYPPGYLNPMEDTTINFGQRGFGLYAHTGVLWNLLRERFGKDSEVQLGFDLRGMIGDDLNYLEITILVGFGK